MIHVTYAPTHELVDPVSLAQAKRAAAKAQLNGASIALEDAISKFLSREVLEIAERIRQHEHELAQARVQLLALLEATSTDPAAEACRRVMPQALSTFLTPASSEPARVAAVAQAWRRQIAAMRARF